MDAHASANTSLQNSMVHQLVSLVAIFVGAATAVYSSSWVALPICALGVWTAPHPRAIALLASAFMIAVASCRILGYLEAIPNELLGLANAALFSCASALLRSKIEQNPGSTAVGLARITTASPVGSLLIDDAQKVTYYTSQCAELFVGETDETLIGQQLSDLIDCPQLMDYLNAPENAQAFNAKPLLVHSLHNDAKHCLSVDVRPIQHKNRTFKLLSLITRESEEKSLQTMREKITQLHAKTTAVNDLIIVIGSNGQIQSHNPAAAQLLPQLLDKNSGTVRLTDLLLPTKGHTFKEAFKAAAQTTERCSSEISLAPKDSSNKNSFVGRLHRFPGSKNTTLIARSTTVEESLKQQLARQIHQQQEFLNASPTAMFVLEKTTGCILEINRTTKEQFGYTSAELIGKSIFDSKLITNEPDTTSIREHLNSNHERIQGEFTLMTKNGETIRAEYSLRSGELAGHKTYFMHARDITLKHRSEIALRESQQKFSRIFTESPESIAIVDLESNTIIDANKQFIERGEHEEETVIGRPLKDFVANRDALESALREVSKKGYLNNLNLDFVKKGGQILLSLTSISSVDLGGKPSLLLIIKDIQKQRAAEAKLRSSEQRFRGTFENAPLGMMLADTSGRIFQANRFAADLLAYSGEDLPGTHLSRFVPASDRTLLLERLEKLISGELPQSHSERRLIAQNGLELWVNLHVVVQRNDEGNPLYFIIQMADISETKRSQDNMERLAFYDTLTNLANRRLYNDRLQQAINNSQRHKRLAALMYLDLDQFKRVNDTLGHDAGDALLKHVAARLQKCVRTQDTVSRPGGDEFTIILDGMDSISTASTIAANILEELRKPVSIAGQQLVVTTSIGISLMPQDGQDAQTLMRNADMAMYKAKERGRNNYQFFTNDMNVNAVNRLRVETELRSALDNEEFELYYQPKIRLADHALIGVECLIRWNHPQRGLLGPVEFISIAEESGVIVNIGSWVIEQACIAGKILQQQSTLPFQIGLNMSPRQFRDPTLINTVRRCLRESDLPPELLELEITETMLMHDIKAASLTVQNLSDLGVKLAIDDFGTGYSSLNYLKRFPIDTIKVDRSFVMDIPSSEDDMAITSAVIAMAHQLKMRVVAEGVETVKQLKFLKEQNCEYAQGYLFGKPMPLDAIRRLIESDNERLVS